MASSKDPRPSYEDPPLVNNSAVLEYVLVRLAEHDPEAYDRLAVSDVATVLELAYDGMSRFPGAIISHMTFDEADTDDDADWASDYLPDEPTE